MPLATPATPLTLTPSRAQLGQGETKFPQTIPRPVLTAVPLLAPLLQLDVPQGKAQERCAPAPLPFAARIRTPHPGATCSCLRQRLQQRLLHALPPSCAPADLQFETEEEEEAHDRRVYARLDKLTLGLIQAACKADRGSRALDLCTRLHLRKSLSIALSLAQRHQRTALAERIQLLIQVRDMGGGSDAEDGGVSEEDEDEEEGPGADRNAAALRRAHAKRGALLSAASRPMSPTRAGDRGGSRKRVRSAASEEHTLDEDEDEGAGLSEGNGFHTPASSTAAAKQGTAKRRTRARTEVDHDADATAAKGGRLSKLFGRGKTAPKAATPASNPFSKDMAAPSAKARRTAEGKAESATLPAKLSRQSSFSTKARKQHLKETVGKP